MSTDLERDYDAAGFNGHLPFGKKPALLLVDAVRAYVEPQCPLYARGESAHASMQRLVSAARGQALRVILTCVRYRTDGSDGGLFFRKVPALANLIEGSPMGEFIDGLQAESADLVVCKQYPSAFFGTTLASYLHTQGTDTLLIGGYSTSGCVRATALDAIQNGFAPFVVREACADRDRRPHEAALFDLQAKYAEVISENDALNLIAEIGS